MDDWRYSPRRQEGIGVRWNLPAVGIAQEYYQQRGGVDTDGQIDVEKRVRLAVLRRLGAVKRSKGEQQRVFEQMCCVRLLFAPVGLHLEQRAELPSVAGFAAFLSAGCGKVAADSQGNPENTQDQAVTGEALPVFSHCQPAAGKRGCTGTGR